MFVGMKELAMPFCFLAKKNGFALDGVVVVRSPQETQQVLPQDFSGVPIIDPSRPPFPARMCFVSVALPEPPFQSVKQSLSFLGFNVIVSLGNEDATEMFDALQNENFTLDTVRAELRKNPHARVSIIDTGSKSRTLEQILRFSGMPIEGVITPSALRILNPPPVLVVPIENDRQLEMAQVLTQQNVGHVLPMFGGDLLAMETYWNTNRMFFDFFNPDSAPNFIAEFEDRIKRIVNAYDGVNITMLNVDSEDEIAKACALSILAVERKVLHVVIPLNAAGNQVKYAAGADNVMLQRSKMRIEVLTPALREFWRYFIQKCPDFVTYSRSIYDYCAARYRLVPLKLDNELISFTDGEREQLCRSKAEKFLPEKLASLVAAARLMISGKLADRWLAMLYGVPIVLINMPTYTLDEKLIVRSDKTPMLMLPKNGMGLPKNTSEEIVSAIEEMLARLDGSFEYRGEEKYMDKTFRQLLESSKKGHQRDVFDEHVSIEFLKNNRSMLSPMFERTMNVALENLLPPLTTSKSARNKIKVRLGHEKYWNAMRTICEACAEDDDIDLSVVADNADEKDIITREGFECLTKFEYDVESDNPDVFLINYSGGYWRAYSGNLRKHSRLVVVASQTLVPYINLSTFIQFIETYWGAYSPDCYLFDSYLYNKLKDIDFFKGNSIVETGNPKYDLIYRACRAIKYVNGWEKLNGKKVILWAPDHGLLKDDLGGSVSFDIYSRHIFEYMQAHPDMAMIFRPHSWLVKELKEHFWAAEDFERFRRYCNESPNVVLDENNSYDNAFALANAVITDVDCGIRMSALPTMKPICISYRNADVREHYPDLTDYCYRVHTPDEMTAFLDMIGRGDDPLHDIREQAAHRHIMHFDGKNGWRIKEFLKQALKNKLNSQRGEIHL